MTERATRVAIAVLAAAGIAISGYLLEVRLAGGRLACTSGGCETVQSSRYSELLGVPLSALGLLAYAAVLASAVVRGPVAAVAGAAIALSCVAFGVYLLVLQLKVIDAVCEWCVASDVVLSLLAAFAILRVARWAAAENPQLGSGAAPM